MIDTIATGSPKVVGLRLCGKLHDVDYQQFVPTLETILTAEGKVRLSIQLEDFHGCDFHAAWDHLKFSMKHFSDFERIAIMGDRRWEKWLAGLCKSFTKAKVKYFDRSEAENARKWLQENEEGNKNTKGKDRSPEIDDIPEIWNGYPWFGQ